MYKLRPYQEEAKEAILAEWAQGHRRTLLVLPTGCGKTICFASVIEHEIRDGSRALVLAHRGELLTQAADKLRDACGIESALEKAESTSLGSSLPVTVGSVQSLAQPWRLGRFAEDHFKTIVVDEAQSYTEAQAEALAPLNISAPTMSLMYSAITSVFPLSIYLIVPLT